MNKIIKKLTLKILPIFCETFSGGDLKQSASADRWQGFCTVLWSLAVPALAEIGRP
jgi:hypothetical protein